MKKQEALLLEEKQKTEVQNERELKALLEQRDLLQHAWKIEYQELLINVTTQQPGSRIDDVLTNGIKLFKVVNEFIRGC